MSTATELYSIWFSSLTGLSLSLRRALLECCGSPEGVYAASRMSPVESGISERVLSRLRSRSLEDAKELLRLCAEQGVRTVLSDSRDYPIRLKSIYSPPPVLYVKGEPGDIDSRAVISLIGTRRADAYGLRMAKRLASEILLCGGGVLTLPDSRIGERVIEGCRSVGGGCIAVLGSSHDTCRDSTLRRIDGCAVISEYPPKTEGDRKTFRERNRLAAGLSVGTLVLQAPENSGTDFFAEETVDQGKELFALPGNVDSPNTAGIMRLLRLGAAPVATGWDVLECYSGIYPGLSEYSSDNSESIPGETLTETKKAKASRTAASERRSTEAQTLDKVGHGGYICLTENREGLTEEQLLLTEIIRGGEGSMDGIIAASGMPAHEVMSLLTVLEIRGYILRDIYQDILG